MFRNFPPRISDWFCICLTVLLFAAPARAERKLEAFPEAVRLTPRSLHQQLSIMFLAGDQAYFDATPESEITVADETVAAATAQGRIVAVGDGKTVATVRYDDQTVEIPVTVEGSQTPAVPSYRLDVYPLLTKTGCNMGTCHGSLTGKGGFLLTLRGDDPIRDLASLTREAMGRRIDLNNPPQSLILRKASARIPHEGGRRFHVDSPEYAALLGWIADGARDDVDDVPTVERIDVFPPLRTLTPGCDRQQLVVTARLSDGTARDVTDLAYYETNLPSGVTVADDGVVSVEAPMEVVVSVRYSTARAISRLVFLPDRPGFEWQDETPNNFIDAFVSDKLKSLRIQPSETVDDATFLRRVSLATIGVLPEPDRVRAFLDDDAPDKRSRLVDDLVRRPEFADFWALKWEDVLRSEQKTMSVKGVWAFRRWLVRQIDRDESFQQTAFEILSSVGSTYRNPAANFYRTNRDPSGTAEAVAQVFLGYRLQCAKCHNHPFDVWRQDDYYGLTAYFTGLRRKQLTNIRRDRLDKHEVNGDELVYLAGKAEIRQPVSGEMMSPQPLSDREIPQAAVDAPLEHLASWVTHDRQFARNVVNRTWYHLLGTGIVDPPDDFRISNPPSNPQLLEALTDRFIEDDFRLKGLVALIAKSKTFQRSAVPNETNYDDTTNFSRYRDRLLPAETLLDAISHALGTPESFPDAPAGTRAVQLPGVYPDHPFMKVFGKPIRLITCECERSDQTTLTQAFQLINGELVRKKIEAKDNRLGRLLSEERGAGEIVEELYAASLCRRPNPAERQAAIEYLESAENLRQAAEDLAWAVINSKEFLLIQ